MKIKTIIALSSVAALLVACATDETYEDGKVQSSATAIAFSVTEEGSRAKTVENKDLQANGFYVYANYSTENTTGVTQLMEGTKITYTPGADASVAGTWGYSPITFWPVGDDKKVSFYPVYGKDDANVTFTFGWDKKPHIQYRVNSDVMKQTDFLWAAPILGVNAQTKIGDTDKTYGNDGISFKYQHALSSISVKVSPDNITYKDWDTYASMKEALVAIKPEVGAIYKRDYLHSIEITGAFPQYGNVNPDATQTWNVWEFPENNKWEETTYTLLASDEASVTKDSKEYAIYKNPDTNSMESTDRGLLAVLPCGTIYLDIVLNQIVECENGDAYLIKIKNKDLFSFAMGQSTQMNMIYNAVPHIKSNMTKLDTVPTLGVALDGEKADGMHAK